LECMAGTTGLEPATSAVTETRFYNDLLTRGDCLNTRKSGKTASFVGWVVG